MRRYVLLFRETCDRPYSFYFFLKEDHKFSWEKEKISLFSMKKVYCLDSSRLVSSTIASYLWMKNILMYMKYAPQVLQLIFTLFTDVNKYSQA